MPPPLPPCVVGSGGSVQEEGRQVEQKDNDPGKERQKALLSENDEIASGKGFRKSIFIFNNKKNLQAQRKYKLISEQEKIRQTWK